MYIDLKLIFTFLSFNYNLHLQRKPAHNKAQDFKIGRFTTNLVIDTSIFCLVE